MESAPLQSALSYLSLKELCKLCTVCKSWNVMASSDVVWRGHVPLVPCASFSFSSPPCTSCKLAYKQFVEGAHTWVDNLQKNVKWTSCGYYKGSISRVQLITNHQTGLPRIFVTEWDDLDDKVEHVCAVYDMPKDSNQKYFSANDWRCSETLPNLKGFAMHSNGHLLACSEYVPPMAKSKDNIAVFDTRDIPIKDPVLVLDNDDSIESVRFSRNGKLLFSAGHAEAAIWDMTTGQKTSTFTPFKDDKDYTRHTTFGICPNYDGSLFVCNCLEKVYVVDSRCMLPVKELDYTFKDKLDATLSLFFINNETELFVGGCNHKITTYSFPSLVPTHKQFPNLKLTTAYMDNAVGIGGDAFQLYLFDVFDKGNFRQIPFCPKDHENASAPETCHISESGDAFVVGFRLGMGKLFSGGTDFNFAVYHL